MFHNYIAQLAILFLFILIFKFLERSKFKMNTCIILQSYLLNYFRYHTQEKSLFVLFNGVLRICGPYFVNYRKVKWEIWWTAEITWNWYASLFCESRGMNSSRFTSRGYEYSSSWYKDMGSNCPPHYATQTSTKLLAVHHQPFR